MLVDYVRIPVSEKQKDKHNQKVGEFFEWMKREFPDGFSEEDSIRVTHFNRFMTKRYLQDAYVLNLLTCKRQGRTLTWIPSKHS